MAFQGMSVPYINSQRQRQWSVKGGSVKNYEWTGFLL